MTIETLVDGVEGVTLHGADRFEVSTLVLDSRQARPGSVFAALAGARRDGREFVAEAVERGAVAVLSTPPRPQGLARDTVWVESSAPRRALAVMSKRRHGRPDETVSVVGVTGTDGKTSTAFATAAALAPSGRPGAICGTLGARIDGAWHETGLTTPEAPEIWSFLRDAASAGSSHAVIEVSSAALVAERVHGMRFRGAILTGMGRDHLDLHGTVEDYRAAKRRLFEMLPEDAFAILPALPGFDDFRDAVQGRVVTFGVGADADWRISEHRVDRSGASFRLQGPDIDRRVAARRPSPWEARNVAAAVAAAVELGAAAEEALDAVLAAGAVPGRWEQVEAGQPFAALVDYAHTPEALEHALEAARAIASGRVIVVFGCGGDRDRGKRPEMGAVAARLADLAFVTDDNPRSEDPDAIAREIVAGGSDGGARLTRVADRARAIYEAVEIACAGDVLLVAGKGHETTQELAGAVVPFDDRRVLSAAMRARAERPC